MEDLATVMDAKGEKIWKRMRYADEVDEMLRKWMS